MAKFRKEQLEGELEGASVTIDGSASVTVSSPSNSLVATSDNNIDVDDSASSAITEVAKFSHTLTSGSGENGIGTSFNLSSPNGAGVQTDTYRVESSMQDVSSGAEFATNLVYTMNDGNLDIFFQMIGETDNNRTEFLQPIFTDLIQDRTGNVLIEGSTEAKLKGPSSSMSATGVYISDSITGTAADAPVYTFFQNSRVGASSNGIGVGYTYRARNGGGLIKDIGSMENTYIDVTNGSEDTKFEFKTLNAGSEVIPLTLYERDSLGGRGSVEGFAVKYSSTTAVTITAGAIRTKEKYFFLENDTSHTMTSLAAGFDFHYIYIDESASTTPTAVIIDSTDEPSYSSDNKGWYSGDDRCIGVVVSPTGSATVAYFSTEFNGKQVTCHYGRSDIPQMASNMDPNSSWQTPDDNDGGAVTPVNATSIKLALSCTDSGANCASRATSSEMAAVNTSITDGDLDFAAYNLHNASGWVILGASRNIKIAGTNDDDNLLSCWCNGFKISR